MKRRGNGSRSPHKVDGALRGGPSHSHFDESLPWLEQPKSHEMDRMIDSIPQRMSNRTYWDTYYEISDERKRRRGYKLP
jgi:hypothetical protein